MGFEIQTFNSLDGAQFAARFNFRTVLIELLCNKTLSFYMCEDRCMRASRMQN